MTHEDKKLCERLDTWGTPLAMDCKQAIERLSAELAETQILAQEWIDKSLSKDLELAALQEYVVQLECANKTLTTLRQGQGEPVAEVRLSCIPQVGDIPTPHFIFGKSAPEGSLLYLHPPVVSEDAKDAEIQRLRKVMFDAWEDVDWLLIANEVYDMKDAAIDKAMEETK